MNLDESEKSQFEEEFEQNVAAPAAAKVPPMRHRTDDRTVTDARRQNSFDTPVLDPKGPSIFQRLFGSWR